MINEVVDRNRRHSYKVWTCKTDVVAVAVVIRYFTIHNCSVTCLVLFCMFSLLIPKLGVRTALKSVDTQLGNNGGARLRGLAPSFGQYISLLFANNVKCTDVWFCNGCSHHGLIAYKTLTLLLCFNAKMLE